MMDKEFNQSIREILSIKPASGLFSKTVEIAGESVTYHFSWNTGMHLNHVSWKYQDCFGSALPEWVNQQHPRHMVKLCQLALDNNSPLPTQLNGEHLNIRKDQ